MNEWVKKIRSSVQSVVEGKRRKSAPPSTGESKPDWQRASEPVELPPPQGPQLASLTKQRARGPPRRRPSPRSVLLEPARTAPAVGDDDPSRFAWGCDPSIDPALFFSDVLGRSMVRTNGTACGSHQLASIGEEHAEGDDARLRASRAEAESAGVEGVSGDSAGASIGGDRASKDADREKTSAGRTSVGERVSEGAKRVSVTSELSAEGQGPPCESSGEPPGVAKEAAGTAKGAQPPKGDRSRDSSTTVLRLKGGEVEGAPPRRLCTIL
ncbi:uncharacterized protein LOC119099926 [Pollicipes pollicipes]|uniref:uncharacterized protein LOC119099926 n=1 Tax=Pollicipes pollicipes TaxID=41117 RepID=UPI001884F8D8|nr:uncharacterized protein LOC119099926 [Pollicipes pollicipes]XP_037078911.1 uncharacterized protein LOC119099926 [Pollicipes pollicipes]XP_037078912.1 uncharacterized protein LOC119099926 [Pollicipes pollicipes]XP_037078913.1 uncharacterized protein LOC119099926 [Pollicipes pollicipes]XP_037078914.1 uncharacterized protein LOC119099926 [Pollicipes pollicipes]